MELDEIIIEMYRKNMIKTGRYRLSSGKTSPYYIDLRILPSYPKLYRTIMDKIVELLDREKIEYDTIAGIETSGIVHASYLGCMLNKPIIYIRRKTKEHGTQNKIEGIVENKKVLLIDDVSTTGKTLYEAVETIRKHGGEIEYAVVIIDRQEGAREKLSEINIVLKPLIEITMIVEVLEKNKLVPRKTIEEIKKYVARNR